ncbi:hypothetical protein ACHQM5_016694 [Ranunculus cassubicifolius]
MSMLDSFFRKGFNGAKCKTMLKLTIPRIKLLRNRREIQIKQMRRDIAKLLETGQEATARIRVEHIIREENMMAAQEILELFCELIAVRLPIIETQRECPLDLKEAISTVCFAAPRCADLPELQQVQLLFGAKYGKEFLAAATELMPDCGVNRQLIELLSIRAPSAEVKLKLLKEIAEEHELDWDPLASETELYKSHEDLLNGPTHLVNESKLPLPKEKHDETIYSSSTAEASHEKSDSDSESDLLDFPEVPKVSLRPVQVSPPELPHTTEVDDEPSKPFSGEDDISYQSGFEEQKAYEKPDKFVAPSLEREENEFSPSIDLQPNLYSSTFSTGEAEPPISKPKTSPSKPKHDLDVDLKDVLAAAHAAAESAERAAAAARSAASLAEVRITELIKQQHDKAREENNESATSGTTPSFDHQQSFNNESSYYSDQDRPKPASYDNPLPYPDSQVPNHQPRRLTSLEDDPYFSYPNLFTTQAPGTDPVDKI